MLVDSNSSFDPFGEVFPIDSASLGTASAELHASVPTKSGIRDAGVAPWILSVCTRCGTQESSEYSISGNYDESGDLKNLIIVGDSFIL